MAGIQNSRITGMGSFVPSRRLTNNDLEKMVDTSDEWIISRTGIKEWCICADDEGASGLAVNAAAKAMDQAGVKPEEIAL